jgi:hypothetical protein
MKAILLVPLATAAILLGSSVNSAFSASDAEQVYNGIRYACTGIGAEAREDPRWPAYKAKLVFAAADGGFLGDVAVRVNDSAGTPIFEARCLTPWLLVDLDPGKYRVDVVARQNYRQTVEMTVDGAGQSERVVRFPEITK